ncbi:hypothetical protein FSARC_5209 [Fusarium sarcochroum]|uniref:SMP-30/Gluconolactonase/LRE-like region domain-containing protein n=1 Tax=Fusarium sarcochroum TaxID=1208366 RepID=A0A8H4TZX9_9HYPO|nr:hypothetical protein FSARC_5209 [Fusarium sarcochroum]
MLQLRTNLLLTFVSQRIKSTREPSVETNTATQQPTMVTYRALWGLTLLSSAFQTLATPTRLAKADLAVVAHVPDVKTLENLAVRHDGNILVTSTTSPVIHYISLTGHHSSTPIAKVPGFVAVTGIVELERDVFYVASTNLTGAHGTNAVWKLDMRHFELTSKGRIDRPTALSLVVNVPDAKVLNGMTKLDQNHILVSDSAAGTVTKVNVNTSKYDVVLQNAVLSSTPTGLGIGVNGIRTYKGRLYFVNLDQQLFASLPISSSTGAATGNVDVILNGTLEAADDFTLSRDGKKAWIAENGQNVLVEVDIKAKTSRIAANCTVLGSISSVALGRAKHDRDSVYITGARNVEGVSVAGQLIEARHIAK